MRLLSRCRVSSLREKFGEIETGGFTPKGGITEVDSSRERKGRVTEKDFTENMSYPLSSLPIGEVEIIYRI